MTAITHNGNIDILRTVKAEETLAANEYYALMVEDPDYNGTRPKRDYFDYARRWIGLEQTSDGRVYISKSYNERRNLDRGSTVVVTVKNPGACYVLSPFLPPNYVGRYRFDGEWSDTYHRLEATDENDARRQMLKNTRNIPDSDVSIKRLTPELEHRLRTRRVKSHMSFDNPPKTYYKVEEIVTTTGLYIDWPESYSTSGAAIAALENTK